ncbi:hypothetical protein GCM10009599_21850 [Luteococcus peritonei]
MSPWTSPETASASPGAELFLVYKEKRTPAGRISSLQLFRREPGGGPWHEQIAADGPHRVVAGDGTGPRGIPGALQSSRDQESAAIASLKVVDGRITWLVSSSSGR